MINAVITRARSEKRRPMIDTVDLVANANLRSRTCGNGHGVFPST